MFGMNRSVLYVLGLVAMTIAATGATAEPASRFLAQYAVPGMARQGMDFGADYFSLDEFPSGGKIDHVYNFRFARLAQVEAALQGVDRSNTLKAIYAALTAGATTNNEKLHRVLKFVQSNMFGNAVQAMYSSGQTVYDPLVLMTLSEYRCGHAARIIVDLFEAGEGWPGRLWFVRSHVTAEVYFDGAWHMAEATFFENGEGTRRADGTYPSYNELWSELALLDRPPSYMEPGMDFANGELTWMQARRTSNLYPSAVYYNLNGAILRYLVKTQPMEQATDKFYGWTHYKITSLPGPAPVPEHYLPSAPELSEITIVPQGDGSASVMVKWNAALDGDNDIVNYRLTVGSTSRQWNYLACLVAKTSNDPEVAYAALNKVPPHDVANITVTGLSATFAIPDGQTAYVSVFAQDQYGLSIGREVFLPSNEYAISASSPDCRD
jgi:hypothetical protein